MNIKDFMDLSISRLTRAGVFNPTADAQRIFHSVLGNPMPAGGVPLSDDARMRIDAIVSRREQRVPLARILGRTTFYELPIKIADGVFQPYPESEALIEPVTHHFADRNAPLRILDIGTGTGCILLALLHEYPNATGLGIDRDLAAVQLAEENARNLRCDARACFVINDWTAGITEKFDVVVSNPPRVPSSMVPHLLPEMRDHDPRVAYDGGEDGLSYFRQMATDFGRITRRDGTGVFQVSDGADVAQIFKHTGHADMRINANYLGFPNTISVFRR